MGEKIDLKECKTFCNESQVYPAMKHFVCDLGYSVRKASREVRRRTEGLVTDGRAAKVYNDRKPATFVAVETESDSVSRGKNKPKIDPGTIYTESFEKAYRAFYIEVQNAKMEDWENTSMEAAYNHLDNIMNLISIT